MINWEKTLENKYNHLLGTEIFILIAYPAIQGIEEHFPIISLLLLTALAPALYVALPRKFFVALLSLGIITYLFRLYAHLGNKTLTEEATLLILIVYAIFFLLVIISLIGRISSNSVVTADTIKGGISIYFLLGFFWSTLYLILLTIEPTQDAILRNLVYDNRGFDCYYYSFTTLTTLGYGDIVPVNYYARILATLEAVVGPVYLAIFVAQIVGLNIAQKLKS
ncbi:MAG: potassium channel family protein [Planctomycetota bacterium]|jgi:hypothetical protein